MIKFICKIISTDLIVNRDLAAPFLIFIRLIHFPSFCGRKVTQFSVDLISDSAFALAVIKKTKNRREKSVSGVGCHAFIAN